MPKDKSQDIQERRSRIERRQFEFALHIPERRRGKDRRKEDKKKKPEALEEDTNTVFPRAMSPEEKNLFV